jgi:hypothetical protein
MAGDHRSRIGASARSGSGGGFDPHLHRQGHLPTRLRQASATLCSTHVTPWTPCGVDDPACSVMVAPSASTDTAGYPDGQTLALLQSASWSCISPGGARHRPRGASPGRKVRPANDLRPARISWGQTECFRFAPAPGRGRTRSAAPPSASMQSPYGSSGSYFTILKVD